MKTTCIKLLKDIPIPNSDTLPAGSIQTVEVLASGSNWKRVRLSSGKVQTLFIYEAIKVGPFESGAK